MLRKYFPYIVGFLLLDVFCCVIFGPVLRHLAEENFFCFERLPMNYVLRQPLGHIYWGGRFLMLPFMVNYVGGIYLSLLLTLTALFADKACGVARKWQGIGFILPAIIMSYAAYRGYNLFMRNEPSQLILWTWGALILAGIAALVRTLFTKKAEQANAKADKPLGTFVAAVTLIAVSIATSYFRQNFVLTCDMMNQMEVQDWEGMIENARSARQPDRNVAAYHVIALNQMGQVLEHAFDLDYDYPTVKLDSIGGMEEGVNYIAECNFHSGLVQPAYHYALEQMVMSGPRLRYLKMMATCSLLNNEFPLCERYLEVISRMPGQGEFVDKLRHLMATPEEIDFDPVLSRIMQFQVMEDKFEQNFRTPAFLGYNVGVLSGTDETLNVSVAAALYSKDMENIIVRAEYLQQKRTLPLCVQQALVIASLRRPGLLQRFPGINQMVQSEVQHFINDAVPYVQDKSEEGKKKMKEALRENWKGSYMYYYYCGNLNQTRQRKTETAVN